jgi:integrase
MRLSDARDAYLTHRSSTGIAENTVKNDRQAIRRLIDTVGDIRMADLGPGHMDALISSMLAGGRFAPGTVNVTQSSLSAWFRWARARGYMGMMQDPIADRRYVPAQPTPKLIIPLGDFPRVIDSVDEPRDKALIIAGLFLMLRQSEICDLRVRDLDLQAGYIDVRRFKTYSKDRLPITPDARPYFAEWMITYQECAGLLRKDDYLIPARENIGQFGSAYRLRPDRPISRSADIVRRVLEPLGFSDTRMGVHILRRSAARAAFDEMAADGYDGALRTVAAWLGHKSVTTTELYLQIDLDRASRDKRFTSQPLYPSLQATNVVPLRKEA